MPELPEVETICRDLSKKLIGQIFSEIQIFDSRVIHESFSGQFSALKNKKVLKIRRRGKGLIFELSEGYFLVVHLRMTGQLIYSKHLATPRLKETKVVFSLSSGNFLNYNDQRLFGRLTATKDIAGISFLKKLGPEPLSDFSADWLKSQLRQRKTPIKVLLMNQEFLAGIGNIYASEILFHARIHPKKTASRLNLIQIKRLKDAIRSILEEAIDFRGTSMRNYRDSAGEKGLFRDRIKVYSRTGEPCVVCKNPIVRMVQAQRSTFFCKQCQK